MEEILISRLSTFAKEVKSLSDQALNLGQTLNEKDENLELARIVKSKLTTILSRFTTELYNYFKICNDPNPDEISDLTNYQLQGWRRARVLLEEFKEMFRNRYLPSLRERYSHSLKQPRVTSKLIPKEGQLVQMKGDKNREGWKVGKIVSLVKSSDGLTRVAQVKVGNTIFTRSIAHLYPLEVEDGVQWEPIPQDTKQYSEIQKFPYEASKESVVLPDTVTIETENTQNETVTDNDIEMRQVENKDETENTVDVTNNEANIETESIDKDRIENDLRDDSNVRDKDSMTTNDDTVEERPEETRHKRIAAVRALERIREWTRNLLTLL